MVRGCCWDHRRSDIATAGQANKPRHTTIFSREKAEDPFSFRRSIDQNWHVCENVCPPLYEPTRPREQCGRRPDLVYLDGQSPHFGALARLPCPFTHPFVWCFETTRTWFRGNLSVALPLGRTTLPNRIKWTDREENEASQVLPPSSPPSPVAVVGSFSGGRGNRLLQKDTFLEAVIRANMFKSGGGSGSGRRLDGVIDLFYALCKDEAEHDANQLEANPSSRDADDCAEVVAKPIEHWHVTALKG
ncbi:unnamed protein product [Protopolystoma xenopodis]|uniref:Uncharacterized protein n=1 Tax=Protopolystoma xenopodis TaxID=117903 RepID=A0A3S5BKM1_9PLAT|nr:unnamed protein product [Protopolystoma xenopodis]